MKADQRILFDDVDQYGPQKVRMTLPMTSGEVDREELESIDHLLVDVTVEGGDLAGEYVVRGEVDYTAELRCGRCLDPFPIASVNPFTVRYRARPDGPAGGDSDLEIGDEDLEVEYYSERSVSLREIAAEQVQLSIPMKTLCDDGCLGLCPVCGANLNKEGCTCRVETTDDRWAALRDIRDELAKKKQS